jgi:hypothetical protein
VADPEAGLAAVVSVTTGQRGSGSTPDNIAHAKYLGKRVVDYAKKLA